MTRPDDVNGSFGSQAQQWAWSAPYPGHAFTGPAQAPQQPAPAYRSSEPQQPAPAYGSFESRQAAPPHGSYEFQQSAPPHGSYGPPQAYPSYPSPQAYPNPWAAPGRPFPPAPVVPQTPPGPSTAKLVALALAGFLVVGLLGGALLFVTGTGGTSGAAPFSSGADAPVVTMALPPTIDGHPQIDNEYSRQLVDTVRQQLAAVTPDPVVGMYGDPGQAPAFVVIAGTTSVGSPDQVLTAMVAGFQQSLGSQEPTFVDQPAGPLGGTMRCAEHTPMTTCMWTVDGAFGVNMVFQQDLAQAAATTLRVREAVETHTG